MMPLCKAIAKQLLGARYEGAVRALAAAGVLYLAVRAAGWQVTVAPAVLCLSTAWYTAGVLLQQLQGAPPAGHGGGPAGDALPAAAGAGLHVDGRRLYPADPDPAGPGRPVRPGGTACFCSASTRWWRGCIWQAGCWSAGSPARRPWCRCLRCKARSCRWGWNGCAPSAAGRPRASSGIIPASTWSRWSCCCWARGSAPPLSALMTAALAVQCAALLWLTGRQKN